MVLILVDVKLPVVLLIGAKSKKDPLASIFAEIGNLDKLFSEHKHHEPLFELESLSSFTTDVLRDRLSTLTNRLCLLHFAGHSDAKSIITDDACDTGSVVYSHRIAGHIKSWEQPPSLIFLNGCKNAAQIKDFHDAGVSVVIATRRAISDSKAEEFAYEFYKRLFEDSSQTSLDEAFDRTTAVLLMNDDSKFRSPSVESLLNRGVNTLDWGIFPKYEQQLEWTLDQLITNDRPVRDKDRQLVNPYKGLAAFQEEDQQWFFGRDKLIKELAAEIPSTNFYSLLGASGSGKSSLISAGVLPRLREMGDYTFFQCHPGNSPFKELVEVLAGFLPSEEASPQGKEQLASSLRAEERSIAELLEPANKSRHVFLIIDQFEELFTQSDKVTIQAFLNQVTSLLLLTNTEYPCFTLILIMRADFLASALLHPEFARLMDTSPHKLLSTMSEVELQKAIEKPAQKQHVSIEGSLTRALLTALEDQTGSLPLLQHVLSLLWNKRKNQVIRLEDYQALGGLEQALENQADAVYSALSVGEKVACKQIFGRLVQLDETRGNATTRRRAYLDEFPDVDQRETVTKLTDARLVTTYGRSDEAGTYIEISHESLIQHWSFLQEWIRENQDEWRLQSKIAAAFKEWKTEGHHEDWLLEGTRLSNAKDWLARNRTGSLAAVVIGESEIAYIEAGIEREERALQEEEARRKLANYQLAKFFEEKVENYISSKSFSLVLDGYEENDNLWKLRLSCLHALDAACLEVPDEKIAIKPETLGILSQIGEGNIPMERKFNPHLDLGEILNVTYSSDGKILATFSSYGLDNSILRFWDSQNGRIIKTLQLDSLKIKSLAVSPDCKTLALGELFGKMIKLVSVKTNELQHTLQGHTAGINCLVYSPNGSLIASGADDHNVILWNAKSGKIIQTLEHEEKITALAFHRSSQSIASGDNDGTIKLWCTQSGKLLYTFKGHNEKVTALAYSPTSQVIATGSSDNTVKLWNIQNNVSPIHILEEHRNGGVIELAYRHDGKVICSKGGDGKLLLWNVTSAKPLAILQKYTLRASSFTYHPSELVLTVVSRVGHIYILDAGNGEVLREVQEAQPDPIRTLITNSYDQIITLSFGGAVTCWKGNAGDQQLLNEGDSFITALDYCQNRKSIALIDSKNQVNLVDVKSGIVSKVLFKYNDSGFDLAELAFDPNGKFIAISSGKDQVFLLDIEGTNIPKPIAVETGRRHPLVYSPNGQVIAVGSESGLLNLLDAKSSKCLQTFESYNSQAITSLAYSLDSNVIAIASHGAMNTDIHSNLVELWNLEENSILKLWGDSHSDKINALAYSPTDQIIASGSTDGEIKLWNSGNGEILRTIQSNTDEVTAIAFSSDGKSIVSGSNHGEIKFWDVYYDDVINRYWISGNNISRLTISYDNKVIIFGTDDGEIRFRNIESGRVLDIPKGSATKITGLVHSPKKKIVAVSSSGDFSTDKPVRLIDTENGELFKKLEKNDEYERTTAMAYSLDGEVIAVASVHRGKINVVTVRLHDTTNGKVLSTLYGNSINDFFSPNQATSRGLASNSQQLLDTPPQWKKEIVYALAFHPDGNSIALGTVDGFMRVLNKKSSKVLMKFKGNNETIFSLAYSLDGKIISSGSADGQIKLWSTANGKLLKNLDGHTRSVLSLFFNSNEIISSGSADGSVRQWDLKSGKLIKMLCQDSQDESPYNAFAFSSDGEFIATSIYHGVRLWRLTMPTHRLLYDFAPKEVSSALKFLWQLELDELEYVHAPHPPSLFPQMGYYISFTKETCKYRELLDMPHPNETKLQQLVRYLEDRCAYKHPELYPDCKPKPLKYDCSAYQ